MAQPISWGLTCATERQPKQSTELNFKGTHLAALFGCAVVVDGNRCGRRCVDRRRCVVRLVEIEVGGNGRRCVVRKAAADGIACIWHRDAREDASRKRRTDKYFFLVAKAAKVGSKQTMAHQRPTSATTL